MKKSLKCTILALALLGGFLACAGCGKAASPAEPEKGTKAVVKEEKPMKIRMTNNGKVMKFDLNGSDAAVTLYNRLPMELPVENFSDNEKIFYPKEKLPRKNQVTAGAKKGTLAYFAPWGNLTIFYKDYKNDSDDLLEIGTITEGMEYVEEMKGTVEIKKD